MNKSDALRKIIACLRLAKDPSATEQEIATALRHAQAMMEQHNITERSVAAAEATEYRSDRTVPKDREPQWSIALSALIAKAFGVSVIRKQGFRHGTCIFIGVSPAPEVAGYSWDVLYRQCKRARQQFLATQPKRLKRSTKTRRGDLFAQAWVCGVQRTVQDFAGTDQSHAIAAYKAEHYPELVTEMVAGAQAKAHDHGASWAGLRAAKGVRLDRPVGGSGREQGLLEKSS